MEKSGIDILTPLQKTVLEKFFGVAGLKENFYLTGGTALSAFYLRHRLSDDLDLFTHSNVLETAGRDFEDILLHEKIPFMKENSSPTFRRYRVESSLQVDLVRDVDYRLGSPLLKDSFMVDSPKNIAINKVLAIYGRLDPKDYVDLFFLRPFIEFDIMDLLKLAQNKDAGIEPFQWAKITLDANNINVLPKMIKNLTVAELRGFFDNLRDEIILKLRRV